MLLARLASYPRHNHSLCAKVHCKARLPHFVLLCLFLYSGEISCGSTQAHKLCEVLVITFPRIKGTVECVLNGLQAVIVGNGEIHPKGCYRLVARFFFNVPPWDFERFFDSCHIVCFISYHHVSTGFGYSRFPTIAVALFKALANVL